MAETTDLQRLIVSMEARSAKLERDLAKAQRSATTTANNIQSRFDRLNGGLMAGFGRLASALGAIGIGVGIASLPGTISSIVNEASGLAKSADRIGITTDRLQELRHTARLADIDVGELDKSMTIFGRNIGQATQGQGELVKVLSANNIALRDQEGRVRSTSDLLDDFADLMKNAGSDAERLRLATIAFGRGGAGMVTALRDGSQALRDTAQEARDLGLVLDEDLLRDAERIGDDWTRLTTRMSTAFKGFVLATVSGVDAIIDSLNTLDKRQNLGGLESSLMDVRALLAQNRDLIEAARSDPTLAGRASLAAAEMEALLREEGRILNRIGELNQQRSRTKVDFSGVEDDETALPSGGGTSKASARVDAIQRVTDALRFEQDQLGRTAREQEIYNRLNAAGVDITSAQGQRIAALAGSIYDQRAALEAAREATAAFNNAVESLGGEAFDAFAQFIDGSKSAEDAIKDLIRQLLIAEARSMFLRAFTPGAAAGPISSVLGGLFGGGRATGGPINPGKIYKVHKDELIVPRVPGTVIPASMVRRGVTPTPQSRTVTVGQVIIQTPDPAAFRRSESQVSAMLGRAVQRSARFT